MLTIRKIGSMQAGDYSGYLAGRAHDEQEAWRAQHGDYYTGPAEGAPDAAGLWRGDASVLTALGVEQDAVVERKALARALRGQRADTGEQVRRPGPNGVVNSHDLTMGVPKSVSVLWAQSSAERRAAIEQATREAAEATVRYMALTTQCVQRRTDSGERVWEAARGVGAAYFVHHTARRASAAQVPDPHLHVHCVVVGVERSDGQLVTPNQAAWVRSGREGGAHFRADLATRLLDLGLELESGTGKHGRFFEVVGVPREVCDRLSGRTQEVEAAFTAFVARYGRLPVEGELADLAVKSRERKGPETVAEIEPYWRAIAAEHGFDLDAVARLWGRPVARDAATVRDHVGEELVARIERQGATVRSREARAMAYELGAGRLTTTEAMQLVADLQERGQLVALSDDRVTTRNTRLQERFCIDSAQRIGSALAQPLHAVAIQRGYEVGDAASGGVMSDEQTRAVEALTGEARMVGLVGRAGAGKGVVIGAASAAYEADGWQVIACATQGARAQGLGAQSSGQVMTINQLVHRTNTGSLALSERTAIFVDEAGTVDTHRMASLLHLCEQHGCSLRLVGDPAQLSAIGPGGLLPNLLALDTVPSVELEEIHRTPHQWLRDFQNLVRDGRSNEALGILREHDAAHMLDTHGDAMQRMVDDWNLWRHECEPGDSLLVVHTTNADVDTVNMLAQAKRLNSGELGLNSIGAPDRDYNLREGDRVMFREGSYRFDDPDERRIENGTRGTIEQIDVAAIRVWVALDEPGHDPRTVEVDLNRCAALRLDYASHVYPAQGDTRTRTAELTGGPGVSRESAYVGGSRLREHHDLYTSREVLGTDGTDNERWQCLADQMNHSRTQTPSIAYTEQPGRHIASHMPDPATELAPGRLADTERDLARATTLRDELRRTFPFELEREMKQVKSEYKQTRSSFEHAERSVAQAETELASVKAWQRDQARQVRERLAHEIERRDQLARHGTDLATKYNELATRPDAPKQWRQQHRDEFAQREAHVAELTTQRDRLREQAIEHNVRHPQRYTTRVLGERPTDHRQLEAWERAARAIETYRQQHNVTDKTTALGREPEGDYKRWIDFDKTRGEVTRARDTMGRSNRENTFTPDRVPDLAVMRPGHGRGFSIER